MWVHLLHFADQTYLLGVVDKLLFEGNQPRNQLIYIASGFVLPITQIFEIFTNLCLRVVPDPAKE